MKKEDISRREKSAAVGLVVCFVAMIAIVGMITFSNYQRGTEQEGQQLADASTNEKENEVADNSLLEDDSLDETMLNNDMDAPYDLDMDVQAANAGDVQAEIDNSSVSESMSEPSAQTTATANALNFASVGALAWPVDGNVILSFNMEQTVYFSTLDQYKYNPAMIIEGSVGEEVIAAATGEVISIENNVQTGTTVRMDLGDGFEAVYGQLKDVCVQEGNRVAHGSLIGYVSEPTKYYSVEGPNLYFQLLKDGEPVNPMEYLEA